MQILVVCHIHRIDFEADVLEIFPCELAGVADVFDAALRLALARQNQDFLHAAVSDDLHFMCDFVMRELEALDVVVAVETAIDTVILAIIRDVERRKEIDRVAEMTARLALCLLWCSTHGRRNRR